MAVPVIRYFYQQRVVNEGIGARNSIRQAWMQHLGNPDPALQEKLQDRHRYVEQITEKSSSTTAYRKKLADKIIFSTAESSALDSEEGNNSNKRHS